MTTSEELSIRNRWHTHSVISAKPKRDTTRVSKASAYDKRQRDAKQRRKALQDAMAIEREFAL